MNTFFWDLQFTALLDLDSHLGLISRALFAVLNLINDVVALQHLAENDVLAIEPGGDDGGDEELRTVGVAAGVGHAEQAFLGVLQFEVLVLEAVAVDGLATGTITLGEVAALNHEALDNAVETRTLVAEALFASSKGTEVLSSL